MSKNVTIVVIILIIVLVAGYLVWLRSKYSASTPAVPEVTQVSPSPSESPSVSPSASASATPSASVKTSSRSGIPVR